MVSTVAIDPLAQIKCPNNLLMESFEEKLVKNWTKLSARMEKSLIFIDFHGLFSKLVF